MSWEPRPDTKIAVLLAAMEAASASRPIWSQTEAAQAMDVPRSMVPNYIAAACNAERLFRRTLANGGGIELSLQRFPAHAPAPLSIPSLTNTTIGEVTSYVPPRMTAPRPGSDHHLPKHAPGTPPAPAGTSVPAPTALPSPAPIPAPASTASAMAPQPAPTATDAGIPDAASAEQDEEEHIEPDAFISCRTGEIVLVGLEPDEEGRITIPEVLVAQIKRQIAWSPAR